MIVCCLPDNILGAVPSKYPNQLAERAFLEFEETSSTFNIQFWADFSRRFPVSEATHMFLAKFIIALSIPRAQISKGIPTVSNCSERENGSAYIRFTVTEISLRPGTHIMRMLKSSASSFRTECPGSIAMFVVGICMSRIVSNEACIALSLT